MRETETPSRIDAPSDALDQERRRNPRPLEPTSDELRSLFDDVSEHLIAFVERLDSAPAQDMAGADRIARSLKGPPPKFGRRPDDVLATIFGDALINGNNSAGPGYLGYVPGGGLIHAAIGDLIAKTVNRFPGLWVGSPGLVQLELNVLRWFCDLVGFGPQGGGILTSGGSMATFSAVFTARRVRLGDAFADARIYTSDQAHHSVRKAAILAGFNPDAVQEVPTDKTFRIDLDALVDAIKRDRGQRPFMLVAQAGSTNTGSADDLERIAEIRDRYDMWLHVDAAYGGFFLLTDHGRSLMRGIEKADSITLDPHKGLFLPYGTGALLVRNKKDLRDAHSVSADYLSDTVDPGDNVDFCMMSPELSRESRGLRLWLPLQLLGYAAFADQLEEKLQLARVLHDAVKTWPDVEIVAAPVLTVVAFRARFVGDEDALNKAWLDRVNARQRVLLSATWLDGRFTLRACVLCFRTHADRIEMAIEDLREELELLRAEHS